MKYWLLFKEGFVWGVGFALAILAIVGALHLAAIIHAS